VTQGQEGVVCEIQLFYTIMTTFDNRAVIIPNSKLSNDIIINNSREGNRRVDVEVKIASYAPDMKTIREAAQAAVQSVEGVLKEPAPTVTVSGLDADGWRIMVRVWVEANPQAYEKIKFAVQENLVDRLKTGQVKLPGM
jgi:small conductance mechanosensitive channel